MNDLIKQLKAAEENNDEGLMNLIKNQICYTLIKD